MINYTKVIKIYIITKNRRISNYIVDKSYYFK